MNFNISIINVYNIQRPEYHRVYKYKLEKGEKSHYYV